MLVAAATDLSLVVDRDGVIRDATFGADGLADDGAARWLGRRWIDTVTVESRPKIAELLDDAAPGTVTRWRQVNHPSVSGIDLPIRYSTLRLPREGQILAIGRDLRAVAALQRRLAESQQALERDYARLRSAETRYRVLFQLAGEAVLIVDAATRRIAEINPAAARLLGRSAKRIVGQDFVDLFEPEGGKAVQALLVGLRLTGQAEDLSVRLAHRRGEARVAAALFRQDAGTSILVRLNLVAPVAAQPAAARTGALDVIEAMPEGFVVTDRDRRIIGANAAFLDLAQLAAEQQAKGELLDRWLGREGSEIGALFATLIEHGSVRHFTTVMRGEFGVVEEVEVAGVSVPGGEKPCLGLTIRTLPRRIAPTSAGGRELPRSVEQMTELVGRVSMKTLVRETTDLIERLCIEAALRITQDNRASAAEMLGLSRQGFYAKLRRYGLGDLDGNEDTDARDE
ncbi:MAG: transcriptional regulator PpsR [Methylobacterium sp.]|uniref:transcriptional regulator PpsR n=1 Tax=Methylobacterium sp. TaxID=409 RepID=UPI00258CC6A6|nr:transcriptional regulator PpsR [Methylobacterium sp.]MBY0295826.1 transcriptional regulator PpsR [Methylobacterium sp.]